MTGRAAVAAAAIVALALGGCGGGSSSQATSTGASGERQIVIAQETEYKIALSKTTLSPGEVTFRAENDGAITHALAISGPGLATKSSPNFIGGDEATMTVTLPKPGRSTLRCPVDGHRKLGMVASIAVQ